MQGVAEPGAKRMRPRRFFTLAVGIAALAAIYLIVSNPFVSATTGADPYSVPFATDTNPDPKIFETTLVAEEATVNLGNGLTARGQTYNGTIPGPTMELELGDTVIVHFENHLPRESSIHWHGIAPANAVDGSPFTQDQVQPGGSFIYKFTATQPGIYWYHPHHHTSLNQVFKGLYGAILVKDPNEAKLQASGALPPKAQTKPIVLSDTTVCKAPGSNDTVTYDPSLPHVSGAPQPEQSPPTPQNLCEGPGLPGPPDNPYPVDEAGALRGPFAAGDIPNIQTIAHAGNTNEGQTVLTNGMNVGGREGGPCTPGGGCPTVTPPGALAPGASVLPVRPGQGLRLQLVNAATTRFFRLQLTTDSGEMIPLIRVGGEGGLLDSAVLEGGVQGSWETKYQAGEILLPPGGRADVVAAIPSAPTTGTLTLWTEDFHRTGFGYTSTPTVPVMHLGLSGASVFPPYTIAAGTPLRAATGDPVETLGAPTGDLLKPDEMTPPKLGLSDRKIQLTVQAQVQQGVDHVFGTHDVSGSYEDAPHLGSTRYVEEGKTIELEVENTAGSNHPYHPHGFSFQPISMTKDDETYVFPYREFVDTFDIPPFFTLKYRVRFDPRPLVDGKTSGGALGRWIFHCHIFFHAMDGMLSELVVTGPGGNERPNVNVDDPELEVTQGGTATATGTFQDPDGDPVSLSSSIGSVTDNGGGRFTWSYPTGRTDSTQLAYITATDSKGLKGQIPIHLKVLPSASTTDAPPTIGKLRVVPKRFAPVETKSKRKGADKSKRKPHGAKIKLALSEPAKVRFAVKRVAPKKPKTKAKKFARSFDRGGNVSLRFTARFKRSGALPPGKYKLTATATDRGGLKSTIASTRFTVVR